MLPESYHLDIDGQSVKLPLIRTEGLCLYSFNLMGKTTLNQLCAQALLKLLKPLSSKEFDVLVAVEAKSLALAQLISYGLGIDEYIVLRKSKKAYMTDSLSVTVQSITTAGEQKLILDGAQAALLQGKRALFLDDVISTGKTWDSASELIAMAGGKITSIACVLTEGKTLRDNPHGFVRLGHIPVYNGSEEEL